MHGLYGFRHVSDGFGGPKFSLRHVRTNWRERRTFPSLCKACTQTSQLSHNVGNHANGNPHTKDYFGSRRVLHQYGPTFRHLFIGESLEYDFFSRYKVLGLGSQMKLNGELCEPTPA